jgi:hypothetical protein
VGAASGGGDGADSQDAETRVSTSSDSTIWASVPSDQWLADPRALVAEGDATDQPVQDAGTDDAAQEPVTQEPSTQGPVEETTDDTTTDDDTGSPTLEPTKSQLTDSPVPEPTPMVALTAAPLLVEEGTTSPTKAPENKETTPNPTPVITLDTSGNAACDANPACAGLLGDCCPVPGGGMLDCCFAAPPPSTSTFSLGSLVSNVVPRQRVELFSLLYAIYRYRVHFH